MSNDLYLEILAGEIIRIHFFAFSARTCSLHRMARMNKFAIFTIKIRLITIACWTPINISFTVPSI